MRNIKLVLLPPSLNSIIECGSMKLDEILSENLLSILSEPSVNKLIYLNDVQPPVTGKVDDSKARELLFVDLLCQYASANHLSGKIKTSIPYYTVANLLESLCSVGDEGIVPSLEKQLHNYALRFNVKRMGTKTYAIIFKPLCEVENHQQRTDYFLKDMKELLSEISLELTDKELLQEDLYQQYLSLK